MFSILISCMKWWPNCIRLYANRHKRSKGNVHLGLCTLHLLLALRCGIWKNFLCKYGDACYYTKKRKKVHVIYVFTYGYYTSFNHVECAQQYVKYWLKWWRQFFKINVKNVTPETLIWRDVKLIWPTRWIDKYSPPPYQMHGPYIIRVSMGCLLRWWKWSLTAHVNLSLWGLVRLRMRPGLNAANMLTKLVGVGILKTCKGLFGMIKSGSFSL